MNVRTSRIGWRLALAIGLAAGPVLVGCGDGEDSPTVSAGEPTRPEMTGTAPTESTSEPAQPEASETIQAVPSTGPPGSEGAEADEVELGDPSASLGVYIGARNVEGVAQFSAWLGNDIDQALDYVDGSSWSSIESPTWLTGGWANSGYRVDFGIPMLPDSGGSLTTGARGGYNHHFVRLAENLVANGQGNAIVRPGWEFNLPLYTWSPGSRPGAYAAFFRQIVTSMRSVPGQRFEFEWNPAIGKGAVAPDRAYPGDRYVDYIGLDVYDITWISKRRDPVARWRHYMNQPYGLRWHRDFSAQHGKRMTFPEWGLASTPGGQGGGDNPHFVQRMHDWIAANDVAGHYYFEFEGPEGDHEMLSGLFPRSAARFRELFGAGSS